MGYIQLRIHFNPNSDKDMEIYRHLEKMGRTRSNYILNLVNADMTGEITKISNVDINSASVKDDTLLAVLAELKDLKTRISNLETLKPVESTIRETVSNESDNKVVDMTKIEEKDEPIAEDKESEEDAFVPPVIPPDLAARLGNY